jgi:glycosyltransferase involved in cell wall biosynthesis
MINNMHVSVIITSYNQGRFLMDAIQSALDVRWPRKEVIVVDDGSTDNSRWIIESFGHRIVPIYKENAGQCSAANMGFARATGDIIFFLDSDDMLLPEAAEEVSRVWTEQTSKVQFQMIEIDQYGSSSGKLWPNFRQLHEPELIRAELLRTGGYQTSITSGNAWSATFLRKVFPLPEDKKIIGTDSYLFTTAPLYGDVRTLAKGLVKYRIHNQNNWAQAKWQPEKVLFYLDQEVRRDAFVHAHAMSLGITLNPNSLRAGSRHMMHRLACKRLFPHDYPFPGDDIRSLVKEGLLAASADPFLSHKRRMVIFAWLTIVGFAPQPVAVAAIKSQLLPLGRSKLTRKLLHLLGVTKSYATSTGR